MVKKTTATTLALGLLSLGTYTYFKRRSEPVPDHPYLGLPTPLVMAHRGGQGLWPPNTIYAFHRSAALGMDVLEMDIHLTRDGFIVVRHDPTVDATTNGSGAIANLTLDEIKALDAGYSWTSDNGLEYPFRNQGITIPTLEEVLIAFPDIRLNIDIKPKNPAIVPKFVQLLNHYDRLESVLVASFHDRQLAYFRTLCPHVATAAGVGETRNLYILNILHLSATYQPRGVAFQPPEYQGWMHVITKRFVEAAHTHNMQVHPWTVNEVDDMERLLSWGVDGLITDYPDRLIDLLGRGDRSLDPSISSGQSSG